MAPVHARLSSVIVTTPQAVALMDVMKCLSFTKAVNLPVLGIIENMSGYVCPCCGEFSNVFSTGGGESMANRESLRFLGSLPIDTELVSLLDASEPEEKLQPVSASDATPSFKLLEQYKATPSSKIFQGMAEAILQHI